MIFSYRPSRFGTLYFRGRAIRRGIIYAVPSWDAYIVIRGKILISLPQHDKEKIRFRKATDEEAMKFLGMLLEEEVF